MDSRVVVKSKNPENPKPKTQKLISNKACSQTLVYMYLILLVLKSSASW